MATVAKVLLLGGILLAARLASAQSYCGNLTPLDPGPPNGPLGCPPCTGTGSPAYPANGMYFTAASDLSLPTAGLPLANSPAYFSTRRLDGPFGIGWTSSLTPRLSYASYLLAAPSTYLTEANILFPSGYSYRFTENANGTFATPRFRHDTLVKNQDGSFDLTLQESRTLYHFAANGSLTSVTDEFGNTQNYSYDGSGKLQ